MGRKVTATQLSLADAIQARDEGQDRVAGNAADWLELARAEARRVARREGTVSTDALRIWAMRTGRFPHHPNAWGVVFRGKEWVCVGRRKSVMPSNHAREIRIWSLTR